MATTNDTHEEITISDSAYDQLDSFAGVVRDVVFSFAKVLAEKRSARERQKEISIEDGDIEAAREVVSNSIVHALQEVNSLGEKEKHALREMLRQLNHTED